MDKKEVRKTLIDFLIYYEEFDESPPTEEAVSVIVDRYLKSINESLDEVPALPTNEDKEKKCEHPGQKRGGGGFGVYCGKCGQYM